jgi:hypothetical protein
VRVGPPVAVQVTARDVTNSPFANEPPAETDRLAEPAGVSPGRTETGGEGAVEGSLGVTEADWAE